VVAHRRHEIYEELLKWFALGVVVAALPIIFNALSFAFRDHPFSYRELVKHGELMLVSVAIVAAALGQLPMGNIVSSARVVRTGLLAVSIVLICLSSLGFAEVSSLFADGKHYNAGVVATFSSAMFVCSMVVGGCSVGLGVAQKQVMATIH
jgi:MFS family permease